MATRQSVTECLDNCSNTYDFAQSQYTEGRKQEHYNDTEYSKAQQMLEDAVNECNALTLSANDQQKEQLYRMRIQLQQLQNEMILLDH